MAKKKRKHRRPVAPPVHSAPGTAHGPIGPHAAAPPPVRPAGAEPPAAPIESDAVPRAPKRARDAARSRAEQRRRRSRRRNYLILASVVLLLAAAIFVPRYLSNRATSSLNQLAEGANCGELEQTGGSGGGEHLREGESTKYDTSPPSHGKHALSALSSGVYETPLSENPSEPGNIFRAVHSLEHGAIIIWHNELSKKDQRDLESEYRNGRKVLVVPYPGLKGDTRVVLTAWGRMMKCENVSTKVIDQFIETFREGRTAPEPKQPI